MTDPQPLQDIFHAARGLPPGDERDAFLDEACGEDRELRRMLEAILSADGRATLVFGKEPSPPDPSVLRELESKVGSSLGVVLDTPGPDTGWDIWYRNSHNVRRCQWQ